MCKVKKLLYVSALAALLLAACGEVEESNNATENDASAVTVSASVEETNAEAESEANEETKEDEVPREYKAALSKAEIYAQTMNMSKAAIYDQLTSELAEGFPEEAAQYAIDNLEWDWKANALAKAKIYAETMAMSDSAIYEQLISEVGEKFTAEEAQYAVDNL